MSAVKYCEPLMKKRFTGATLSEAKTKALKWAGKNVLSNGDLADVMCKFESCEDEHFPTVSLVLYVALDESEVRERHCKICREFHKLYFINENCNCNECKAMAIQERMHSMLAVKKNYYREQLKKALEVGIYE